MATYEPEIELFRTQIESIRAQTVEDWICLISDDCSSMSRFELMQEVVAGDERFVLRRAEARRGFYRNFERALELMPRELPYVALADQDDRWYPDKLETLIGGIGDAQLVYSDQRVVDEEGRVLAPSYWTERRNNYVNLPSLLLANTVTGAASLFRRELLDLALPFPETPGTQYHDHWLALVALASGRIAYIDRPLYDYVQHGSAALGHAAASVSAVPGPREIVWRLRRRRGVAQIVASRPGYFFDLLRLQMLAVVLLMRCGRSMRRRDRRSLRRLLRAERSPVSVAWLALRPLRNVSGHSVTLGAERLMLQAVAWRYAMRVLSTGRSRPRASSNYDASLPPPSAPGSAVAAVDQPFVRHLASKVEPLRISVTEQAPKRVNILIPTIDLAHLFGGYIAKFNLARRLAERGHRTRLVTVDPAPQLPGDWRERVESFAGLGGLFDQVEVAFGRDRDAPLELNPDDSLIATTWWTAHIAGRMLPSLSRRRFLYLIQEYEPYTFPMGSLAALAKATYELPHVALFSTELLRDFFAAYGYGVFAAGREEGQRDSVSFQNAITDVSPPTAAELARRDRRRLLFYARPEQHAARNMFELGALALTRAILDGVFGPDWSFHGIGAVQETDDIRLGSANLRDGHTPRSVRLRRVPHGIRRRAGPHVHAASEPGSARDGLGRARHRHQYLRDQDAWGDGGDLRKPPRGGTEPRRHRRRSRAGRRTRGGLRSSSCRLGGRLEQELGPLTRRSPDGVRREAARGLLDVGAGSPAPKLGDGDCGGGHHRPRQGDQVATDVVAGQHRRNQRARPPTPKSRTPRRERRVPISRPIRMSTVVTERSVAPNLVTCCQARRNLRPGA